MLTLIGITPTFPLTFFDSTGHLQYNASTHALDMTATPLAFYLNASSVPSPVTGPASVAIHALVDNSGNLIGGNGNPNFQLTGTVDVNGVNESGTLLTGTITQFGYKYNSGTSTNEFDFRFQFTGGQLQSLYTGMDIGVTMDSENSSSFTGSFETSFGGGAKGEIGAIPLAASIHGYKFDDVNDNGVDHSDPRLNNWTITLTGTDDQGNPVSQSTTTATTSAGMGEYSFTGLTAGTYTINEVQQSGWTKTVGGTTITLAAGEQAVAYSGEAGTLLPGQTEVVTAGLAFGNYKPSAIVIGMDKSPATPQSVEVINPNTGAELAQFVPYGNTSQGGVRVATGNLTGSGSDDIVTAPGRGNLPIIRIYTQTGTLLTQFQAYPSSVNGGLQVAVADVTGDGLDDIITVPSYGPAEVRVFMNMGVVNGAPTFDAAQPYRDFLAFPPSFIGGAVVAAAGMGSLPNGNAEIIVGSSAGMKATVAVFDVSHMTTRTPTVQATPVASFTPFSTPSKPFSGGVSLSVAQLSAGSLPDIVVGAGANGRSLVDIWGWNTANDTLSSLSGSRGFAAFTGPSANAAVQVATLNNGAGIADAILAVQGPGGTASQVVQLDILSVSPLSLSAPEAIPGSYPGPYTIAAIDNVLSGLPTASPLASSSASGAVKGAAALTTTTTNNKPTVPAQPADWLFALLCW